MGKPSGYAAVTHSHAVAMNDYEKEHLVSKASGWNHLEVTTGEATIGPAVKYAITGNENQVVTVALNPGDTCQGEPGVMMYLSPGVTQHATCAGGCCRCLSGESCCVLNFTNSGSNEVQFAAMTPNEPLGKVVPVDLSSRDVNGVLIVQQGSYMGSIGEVEVGVSWDCNFIRCCCAGTGLARQKLTGSGVALLGVTGTIVQKVLAPGEVMVMDTNCILAFSESCKLDIRRAAGIVGMVRSCCNCCWCWWWCSIHSYVLTTKTFLLLPVFLLYTIDWWRRGYFQYDTHRSRTGYCAEHEQNHVSAITSGIENVSPLVSLRYKYR